MRFQIYNTLFIGKVVIQLTSVKSTNNYAIKLLAKSKPSNGTVVFTNNQTAGRGQYGTTWESDSQQNITLSVIVYPTFLPVNQQFNLNICVAIGIVDFLKAKLPHSQVSVKWPNDIYLDNKKLGGVLIQNTLRSSVIRSSVIGIGLNINQTEFNPLLPNPVSLSAATGETYNIEELVPELLKAIEIRYLQLQNGNTDQLITDYLDCLYLKAIPSVFKRQNESSFNGTIQTINEIGQLVVLNNDTNQQEVFSLKEIRFPRY